MNVVDLKGAPLVTPGPILADNAKMLAIIDELRRQAEAGEIVAFTGVGLSTKHETTLFIGAAGFVPAIVTIGAVAALQHTLLTRTTSE